MIPPPDSAAPAAPADPKRRRLLAASSIAMAGGLVGGYGTFAAYALRFLHPAAATPTQWMFVARVADIPTGGSIAYKTPAGAPIAIARQGSAGTADDFIALSSACPHLGCQVHWESNRNRFFCPCHNGVFNPQGLGTEGPPKGQSLRRYPLKIERELLYIETPVESLAVARRSADRERA
jgi:nitrite reductase/ring-hydroxylating ferredoxin subunit